jgi:putative ABC transport system permease protein
MSSVLLASRNLLRNRRRSLATLLALGIGCAAVLLFGGYSKNIEYSLQTAYVRTGGHLQIQHRDFFQYGSGNPTAYGIDGYRRIIDAIRNDPVLRDIVVVATPTLQFGGIAGNYKRGVSRTMVGLGLVPEDQRRMRDWNDFDLPLVFPPSPLEGAAADAAIVGTALARVLQLCESLKLPNCAVSKSDVEPTGESLPDDIASLSSLEAGPAAAGGSSRENQIEILASSSRGTPNVTAVQVIAGEQQAFKELDEVYVSLNLAHAQRLIYGVSPPKVTSIMVQLRHSDQIPVAQARLDAVLPATASGTPLAVLDFRALNPFYVQSQILFEMIFGFIYCLIGSIVLFTIGNTMNMAVAERTVEIGTLRSIGMRRSDVRRLFVLEGLLLGATGALAGLAFALLASFVINRLGLTWLPPGSAHHLPLTLIIWGQYPMILGTTFGLIAIAAFSALWPAHRASKLVIVDALRHA